MKTTYSIIHWAPRVFGILAVAFVSLFALDSFNAELSVWQQIRDFLIHLIPSFILLAILILAWKKELVGGIVFVLIGGIMSPYVYKMNYDMNHSVSQSLIIILTITIPFVIVGGLFIWNHFLHKKNKVNS